MNKKTSNQNNEVHYIYESQYEPDPLPRAGRLGLFIFLASLTMLFAASLTGYLIVRYRAEEWPPPGMPSLPDGLWVSTLILLLSSITMHLSSKSVLKNELAKTSRYVTATFALGLIFLLAQWWNWSGLIAKDVLPYSKNLYSFTFFMLTGLHAVHVLGGIFCLGVVTYKSWLWRYSSQEHSGMEYCSIYWHFLDAMWIVIYVILIIAG